MELPLFDSVGIGAEISVAGELGELNDVAMSFSRFAKRRIQRGNERNEMYETCNENSARWGQQYGRRAFNFCPSRPQSGIFRNMLLGYPSID